MDKLIPIKPSKRCAGEGRDSTYTDIEAQTFLDSTGTFKSADPTVQLVR